MEYSDKEHLKKLHKNNEKLLTPLSVEISRFERSPFSEGGPFKSSKQTNLQPNTLLYNEDGIYRVKRNV